MKKIVLISAALVCSAPVWAQKKNVNTAQAAITREDYAKAIEAINEAVNDPVTKAEAKTWFVRGEAYTAAHSAQADKYPDGQREAARSYLKAAELDPSFRKAEMNFRLQNAAQVFYNDGIRNYQEQKYKEAYEAFSVPLQISRMDGGKRFGTVKSMDTVAAYAQSQRAYSAFFGNDLEKALPDLLAAKASPIARDENIYLILLDIYQKQDKVEEAMAVLNEGRKLYPDNTDLRNAELNMYLKAGNQEALLRKLEEAVAKDPSNAELQFNLGNGYNNLAFPKDVEGKDLPRPENFEKLVKQAEEIYLKAISLDKNSKPEYSYNLGALYFNQASGVINAMNQLGMSAEDQKKYDELSVQRDAFFGKALPHLEKTLQILEPNVSKLSQDDQITYQSVLFALREVYAKQNKMDKAAEMKRKLDAYRAAR